MMLIKYIILKFIFFIIQISTSWKYHGVERFNKLVVSNQPVLVCVWHGYFIFPMIFLKILQTNKNCFKHSPRLYGSS